MRITWHTESIVWTGDNADLIEKFLGRHYETWIPSTGQIAMRVDGLEFVAERGDRITKAIQVTR